MDQDRYNQLYQRFLEAHLNGKDLPRLSDDELGELIEEIQKQQLVTRKERATAGMKRTKTPPKPVDVAGLMAKMKGMFSDKQT